MNCCFWYSQMCTLCSTSATWNSSPPLTQSYWVLSCSCYFDRAYWLINAQMQWNSLQLCLIEQRTGVHADDSYISCVLVLRMCMWHIHNIYKQFIIGLKLRCVQVPCRNTSHQSKLKAFTLRLKWAKQTWCLSETYGVRSYFSQFL